MRRAVGFASIGALAVALSPFVAFAFPSTASTYDLRTALFASVFGETTDWRASVAAASGDSYAESPLRDLALKVESNASPSGFSDGLALGPTFAVSTESRVADGGPSFDLTQTVRERLLENNAAIAAPTSDSAPATGEVGYVSPAQPSFTVGTYQPVTAPATVRLQSGAVSFAPVEAPPRSVASALLPGAAGSTVSAPATLRVGPLHFQGQVQEGSAEVQQPALRDNSYDAGANFALRAGGRNVDVGLTSSYEQLTGNDAALGTPSLSASWQLPGGDVPLVIPNSANLSRLSLGAGLAVPLINGVTLNLNYDTARMLGSYGLPGLTNLDAIDNAYGGRLTFAIPHSSSTLSVSAYQYRYQDNILPASSLMQTRENVNFTVNF